MKRSRNIVRENEPGGINIKQLFYSIYTNRYRILLFGVLGVIIAILYNMYVPQKYSAGASLLVKTDNTQATLTTVSPNTQDDKKSVTVQNQIGVLSSFALHLQTVKNLHWDLSWSQKRLFQYKDLYKNAPFKIDTTVQTTRLNGVPLKIKQVNANQYSIESDGETEINGEKQQINFKSQGYYGRPFKSAYFSFTLSKIPGRQVADGDEYVLTFNDLAQVAKAYQEDVKVKTGDNESNMVYLELDSRTPNRAVDYLNELCKVYISYGLAEKNRLAANTVQFIDRQIAGIADSLKSSGDTFTDYRTSNNVVDLDQQSASIVNDMGRLATVQSAAQMKLSYLRNLKRSMRSSSLSSVGSPAAAGIADPSISALTNQLSDLSRQREALSNAAQDNSPQIVALDNQISYIRKNLDENVNSLINNTSIELNSVNQQLGSVSSQGSVMPKTEQKLNSIKRSYDFNNGLYTYLLQKRSEAQIAQASRDPDARIIDVASMGNTNPKGFSRWTNLLIGLVLGMLLPMVYLTGKTFFKNGLEFISDVKQQLQPSIIGNILHNKFDNELPSVLYPHSEIAESFRGLRINIQYLLKDRATKVISVHSSIAGEGKTFVSANLATVLAINNKSVLLIDADLRKPRSHKIFNCANNAGLSSYLEGQAEFSDVIIPTKLAGLSLVPSGPRPDYPSELLGNNRLETLITTAKKYYEYIIINNAPLSIVKDGMMLAPYSDMNLFLLRMKSSSINELSYINELVQEGVVKNLVVAINNVTAESYGMIHQPNHGYYNDNRLIGGHV